MTERYACWPCGGSGEFGAGTPFEGGDCDCCGGAGSHVGGCPALRAVDDGGRT